MVYSKTELAALLAIGQFPRSASYEPEWVLENLMGPNVLWLTEALSQVMDLKPGMRVLDMGCGRAISSIFLAKEFGLQVWATDLWISASENWQRVSAAGVANQVFPIHVEAHALPFADGFFDALVSLDAYHYFGTDDLYLGYYSRFVQAGGQIGIVVPGLRHEFTDGLPEYLVPYWLPDYWSFHSPDWWQKHWVKTGKVEVACADLIPHGWQHWLKWQEICLAQGFPADRQETDMLRVDAGRNLGFTRIVARKKEGAP
ncbi:MAG: methyltransferase domain-containing protein [Candidatus Tectomicrobia bacterium]|nr:methyltransferase domain-containing protein [Candidatus Tectomicrobia bacterium]